MKKFEFSSKTNESVPIFSGKVFYNKYKNSDFLKHNENIETILSKGYELRQMLKEVQPGEVVVLKGMVLNKDVPLVVKKTGPKISVGNFEFTANRLTGLVAAYAFENRGKFVDLKSSEALALGLTWNNGNESKCRLFLSAVTGTEHFYEQFYYWPLVCALRKLQLEKMTVDPVIKIAKVKNNNGEKMAKVMMRNLVTVKTLWLFFPDASNTDLEFQLKSAPQALRAVIFDK